MKVIHGSLVACLLLLPRLVLLASDTITEAAAQKAAVAPPIALSGGASSLESLIDEFLAAIEKRDKDALNRLRLTKDEYTEIIVPGEVPKGQTPRKTYAEVNDVFWEMLDSKSRYVADMLVAKYGGHHYVDRQLRLTKGVKEWAGYTGHGEVRLMLNDKAGEEVELRSGWIAEVGGRYKFIGFNWSD